MDIKITELNGKGESEAALLLWKLYERLEHIGAQGRKRVYARWEHLKMIPAGDGARWEKELQRITKSREV